MKTKKYLSVVIILTMLLVLVSATSVFAAAEKLPVCHVDEMGIFHLINISDNAFDTHIAHGDVEIGDVIPGMAGMTYGTDCKPVKTFADVSGVWTGQSGLKGVLGYSFTMTLAQDGTDVTGSIVYPGLTTRTVTGIVSGYTLTITTAEVSYTATVSGTTTGSYFYGEGTGTPISQLVALEAWKQ